MSEANPSISELIGNDEIDWSKLNQPFGSVSDPGGQVVVQARDPRLNFTQRDIDTASNLGMAFSGGGLGIKAFHGSPHDFDAFDLSKIGTGEGAQAFGHGLYFAENPGVAESYKNVGARRLTEDHEMMANSALQQAKGDRDKAIQILRDRSDQGNLMKPVYDRAADLLKSGWSRGKMYEVDINADPEHFLDWDRPLSEQHPKVQEAAGAFSPVNLTGKDMMSQFSDPETIAEALHSSGIPGIKYLDQRSRAAGEGSRNYVVFDDKIIKIIRKYGLAGLSMLPPATANFLSQKIHPVDNDPFLTPVEHNPFASEQ